MKGSVRQLLMSLLLLGVSATGCAAHSGVIVRYGPPRPPVEVVTLRPGPRYVWVPGFYAYRGSNYRWVPGTWVLPPRGRTVYVPGHWAPRHGGYFWTEGRWR